MKTKVYEGTIRWTLKEEMDVQGHADTAEAVVAYMGGAFASYPEKEQFWVLFLNRRNVIKGRMMITLGTLSSTVCAPREVFRAAVIASAAAIIVVHNLCDAAHRLCYVARRAMCSDRLVSGLFSLCAAG